MPPPPRPLLTRSPAGLRACEAEPRGSAAPCPSGSKVRAAPGSSAAPGPAPRGSGPDKARWGGAVPSSASPPRVWGCVGVWGHPPGSPPHPRAHRRARCPLADTQRALRLLEEYRSKLSQAEDRQLRNSIERVINIFQSNLFQALIGKGWAHPAAGCERAAPAVTGGVRGKGLLRHYARNLVRSVRVFVWRSNTCYCQSAAHLF